MRYQWVFLVENAKSIFLAQLKRTRFTEYFTQKTCSLYHKINVKPLKRHVNMALLTVSLSKIVGLTIFEGKRCVWDTSWIVFWKFQGVSCRTGREIKELVPLWRFYFVVWYGLSDTPAEFIYIEWRHRYRMLFNERR